MSGDLVEIVDTIRKGLDSANLFKLKKAFIINDLRGDGTFDFESFEGIMNKCGIFLKRQQLTKIYHHFNSDPSAENLSSKEFIAALVGELSATRAAMVNKAYAGTGGDWSKYNAAGHPAVQMGAKTVAQINDENETAFNAMGYDAGAPMSAEQFLEFYSTKSASDPYDDNNFIASISGPWGVAPDGAGEGVTAEFLMQVRCVLREKVRQHTKSGSQESECLRLKFQKLDLEDTGFLDYEKFGVGLDRFGCVVVPSISRALFESHAENGRVNIASFSEAVCSQTE